MDNRKRVAFVSGAGQGMGRAIALALSAKGRMVAVGDIRETEGRETVDRIANAGGRAAFVAFDVTKAESVRSAITQTESELGPIDVLVNNIGWDQMKPFINTDEDFWRLIVDINYLGNLRLTHTVLPGMLERKWGRIVNISSDAARVGSSFEAVYSGAKGAVVSFTKTLAREVAKNGITVNTVCPGPTLTPALEGAIARNPKILESMVRAVPMGRVGQPDDVATAVAFFGSDEASFITGQTLSVSGGLTMA